MRHRLVILSLAGLFGALAFSTEASACCHRMRRLRHCGRPACAAPTYSYGSCGTYAPAQTYSYTYAPATYPTGQAAPSNQSAAPQAAPAAPAAAPATPVPATPAPAPENPGAVPPAPPVPAPAPNA